MSLPESENSLLRKQGNVEFLHVVPLIVATALLTAGLTMFLGGTYKLADVVRPFIVVFGGTCVSLLITFPISQIMQSWQVALYRVVYGGALPEQMIRALLKVCDISRRDGLLGVAEIQSSSSELEEVCQLIGDAAEDTVIELALARRQASEHVNHAMVMDIFLFTAMYALLIGMLASLLLYVGNEATALTRDAILPLVCGASVSIIMAIFIGRLRTAHRREMVVSAIAFQGALIILEDNNTQRLQARLAPLVPPGFRR